MAPSSVSHNNDNNDTTAQVHRPHSALSLYSYSNLQAAYRASSASSPSHSPYTTRGSDLLAPASSSRNANSSRRPRQEGSASALGPHGLRDSRGVSSELLGGSEHSAASARTPSARHAFRKQGNHAVTHWQTRTAKSTKWLPRGSQGNVPTASRPASAAASLSERSLVSPMAPLALAAERSAPAVGAGGRPHTASTSTPMSQSAFPSPSSSRRGARPQSRLKQKVSSQEVGKSAQYRSAERSTWGDLSEQNLWEDEEELERRIALPSAPSAEA